MTIVKTSIHHLNPGQIPVVACDQQLHALAKLIQWKWSEELGGDKYVVMLGGLHTEMALWRTLGDVLDGS